MSAAVEAHQINLTAMQMRRVSVILSGFAFRYSHEIQLHEAIASVLDGNGIPFQREVAIDAKNRVDFLLAGGLAIEVKVDGTFSQAITQVNRYCGLDAVHGVLLAAACAWARLALPASQSGFQGKPVGLIWLRRKAL